MDQAQLDKLAKALDLTEGWIECLDCGEYFQYTVYEDDWPNCEGCGNLSPMHYELKSIDLQTAEGALRVRAALATRHELTIRYYTDDGVQWCVVYVEKAPDNFVRYADCLSKHEINNLSQLEINVTLRAALTALKNGWLNDA